MAKFPVLINGTINLYNKYKQAFIMTNDTISGLAMIILKKKIVHIS